MRSSTTVQHATPEQRSHSRRSSNRRDQILRTTAHLFLERGFETTSMGDIAAANQISKPGLYYHFASKQALLAAIIDLAHDKLETELDTISSSGAGPEERLRRAIHAHALGITRADDAAFSVLAIAEVKSLLAPDRERISRRKRRYVDFLRGLLDDLAAAGRTHGIDTTAAAYTLAGMVLWIPLWYKPSGRLSAEQVADEVTLLVMRAALVDGAVTDRPARRSTSQGSRSKASRGRSLPDAALR